MRSKIAATRGQAGHHQRPARVIAVGTQVDRWGMLAGVQAGQPAGALPQPARLIGEPVRGSVPAVQFRVIIASEVFRGWPARSPHLTQRRVQLIEADGSHATPMPVLR